MWGSTRLTTSPSSSSTRRRTPCAAGCCGPKLMLNWRISVSAMGSLGLFGARESREHLGTRKLRRIVGEIVVGGLLVDEYLRRQNEPRLIIERVRGEGVVSRPEKAVVEGAATHLAERPLLPHGRLVDADIVRALECDSTIMHQANVGSSRPAPAHAAMAGVDLALGNVGP